MQRKPIMASAMLAIFLVMLLGAQPVEKGASAAGTTGAITTKSSNVALNVAVAFELSSLTAGADYGLRIINGNDGTDSDLDEKYLNWTAAADETSRIVLITFGSNDVVQSNKIIVTLTGSTTFDIVNVTLAVTAVTDIISTSFLIGLFGVLFVLGVLVIIMKSIRKG